MADSLARCEIPLYATMVIAARIAITTTTMSNSTIVKAGCAFLIWHVAVHLDGNKKMTRDAKRFIYAIMLHMLYNVNLH